jgi:hypothetical protein
MKRGILLSLALLLVLDLAQDDCLGKAKFVTLHSSAEVSPAFPLQCDSRVVDALITLPLSDRWKNWNKREFQPVLQRVQIALKIIVFCNNGSSGGIPL